MSRAYTRSALCKRCMKNPAPLKQLEKLVQRIFVVCHHCLQAYELTGYTRELADGFTFVPSEYFAFNGTQLTGDVICMVSNRLEEMGEYYFKEYLG